MATLRCRAVLFDMDGVLVDSTPVVARVWRKWALERGFNPEKVVRAAHGRTSLDTVRDFLPHADANAENLEVERRECEDLEGVVAMPGAQALLKKLAGGALDGSDVGDASAGGGPVAGGGACDSGKPDHGGRHSARQAAS
jgi:mannitol-1-/sugar-/sorbitol-6-phosphatase